MTPSQALEFVGEHGVVLASAKGSVPRLTEAIVGAPIKGSWWAHPDSHGNFHVFQFLAESPDVVACRLVNGKITFVHRRLWPALVRAAAYFSPQQLEQVSQEHTPTGQHIAHSWAFEDWIPAEAVEQSKALSEQAALNALGPWACTASAAQGKPTPKRDPHR